MLPIEKFPSLVHLIIQFSLHYLSSGHLQEIKNKRTFQTFSSKRGCGRLQEVPNSDLAWKRFGILDNWSLRRGGRNWSFDCTSRA